MLLFFIFRLMGSSLLQRNLKLNKNQLRHRQLTICRVPPKVQYSFMRGIPNPAIYKPKDRNNLLR